MSEFSDLLQDLIDHGLEKIEQGFVAKIVKFDATTMRAEIQPLLRTKTEEDGKDSPRFLDIPNIDDVPVEMIYAGGFYIRPPYAPGDLVKCTLASSSLEKPIDDNIRSDMLSNRFMLNYCTVSGSVLPKGFTAPSRWGSKTGLLIGKGDNSVLEVTETGIEVKGDLDIDGDLNVTGTIKAKNVEAEVDVKAGVGPLQISLLTHTHPVISLGSPTGAPLP